MSNHQNEQIAEGLADEYYDNSDQCMEWLAKAQCDENEALHLHEQQLVLSFMTEEEQCEEYVNFSMEMMAWGYHRSQWSVESTKGNNYEC